ncbi:MAG: glutathione S-transferase [Alphaproteobacteria bacterium]|nr:glutathione S-transferase [Alphaproteobacteria bacterium]
MRARLALECSGSVVELREVVLRDKPAEMLVASPKGTVPVIVLRDGTVIEESLDIMLWALGSSDPEGWLAPEIDDLGAMLALIAETDAGFKRDLDAYKYTPGGKRVEACAARVAGSRFLCELDSRLRHGGFLFGGRAALADNAIFPFVRQFANVDREWFDDQAWPALRQWLDHFLGSARFEKVMKKYAKWTAGDEPVMFG